MILIGQYDSPFVRRVAIALALYELPFEHKPWSTFGDMQKVQAYNPLVRVPTLVLDEGAVLIDSHSILDCLDQRVGAGRALFPATGAARRDALKVAALATGMGDKAVGLFYERHLHDPVSEPWVERCRAQILGGEFRVRIPPQLHRSLALAAAEEGVSLKRLASAKLAA